jgi:WD repeat-containing protein 26
MIPEHRLAVLLDHVKNSWIAGCLYHNTLESPSLYIDHECDPKDFPRNTILELRNHTDEVWYLKYSHDGSKLATASSDKTIVIYDTTTYKVLHTLNQHESGVCFLTWSPDDTKLISCSQAPENSARVWDVRVRCFNPILVCFSYLTIASQTGIILREMSEFTYPVTTATWAPDGETFVTGSQDIDHSLIVWNLSGNKIHQWKEENLRVHDLAISPDGQRLVVLLAKRIFVYDYITRAKLSDWSMGDAKLTSVAITQDSRYMLVSKNDSKIRLMDIETGQLLQTFIGHTQMEFVIRSSFGGAGETFVVSGSEGKKL